MKILALLLTLAGCTERLVPPPDAGVDATSARRWSCFVERWCADGSYTSFWITLPQDFETELEAEDVMVYRCEMPVCTDAKGQAVLSRCHAKCK